MTYCGRFAPSPTGPLHLGSLVVALGSWLLARQAGGRWLLRVENIDPPREVPGAILAQLRTLAAFGLHADEPVLYQSSRSERYQHVLQRLLEQGDAFICHCSRRLLAASGGIHRDCTPGASRPDPTIRLRVLDDSQVEFNDGVQGLQSQDVARAVGDVVLRRSDGLWAYQLAVVIDDADQGVTHVVRGADLLDSTARQILLQRRLGLPTPQYAHLPLVLGPDGRKLSKSLAATTLSPHCKWPGRSSDNHPQCWPDCATANIGWRTRSRCLPRIAFHLAYTTSNQHSHLHDGSAYFHRDIQLH